MSDSNLTIDDLKALPERMRAHAAAKAVGMTSKEFLAAMAGIGVEIKNAQSAVTREGLLTWFNGRDSAPTTGAPAAPAKSTAAPAKSTAAPVEPAAEESTPPAKKAAQKAPAKKAPAKKAPAAETPAKKAAQKAPAKKEPAKKAPAKKAPSAKSADTAPSTSAPAEKAPAKRPLVRTPLPEIAIVTGEVGADDSGNRRRRSTATPTFSPLFLSPDEAAAEADARGGQRGGGSRSGSQSSGRDDARKARSGANASSGGGASAGDSSAESTDDDQHDGDNSNSNSNNDGNDDGNDDGNGEGGNRRRRRGRRGRGRGRGESSDGGNDTNDDNDDNDDDNDNSNDENGSGSQYSADTDDSADSDDSDGQDESSVGSSDDGSDDSNGASSGSRRRRRRRRRSGGGGSGSDDSQGTNDDPPNTEVHEREQRKHPGNSQHSSSTSVDEVQGISGSTRLEAKRQRRRDGREAGRRRQPILSESEFLARRESVDRVMVVREKSRADGHGGMTQVGVLEDKVLVEHFVTTESARSMVGNVYLGRVQNVLPSMEAAFVDIGRGRNGVLYAGEVNWEAAGLGGKARRIEQALKPGNMVLVQVTKDPIGQKGARLSTQISLAGRFLVYVPDGNSTGISRKLPDTERRRLKAILKDVVPEGSGVIIRTAAEGVSEEEIGRDVERLATQWTQISEAADKRKSSGAGTPTALYEEPDLLVKVVRDLFNEDFSALVIQGESSWNTVHDYVSRVAPEMLERLERYENPDVDVFATHRVDEQLAKALDRKVWLPSGGSLVIDRTEAMTVVDVNTGKYTGSGGNLEETVTKNNLEAAEEVVRQLRLRDIGGMVIIDFIDMVLEGNRDLVLRRITEALGRDRTRHQVSEVTSLGLVQLTRKKLGTGLVEAFSTPCETCQGRGLLVHADPVHTESHNADDPGGRRGRRRGGKATGGSGQDDAPKQAPRKDGPAPAAHPAALAMGRGDEDEPENKPAESKVAENKPAETKPAEKKGEPAAANIVTPEVTTADVAKDDSGSTSSSKATSSRSSDASESSDKSSTRTRSRRRATRRPAGEVAAQATPSTEDVTAGPDDAAPATNEAAVAAEAVKAVETVETTTTTGEPAAGGRSAAGGGRTRRRSTRREAGAAAPGAAKTTEPAPVTAAPVEPAQLAEVPIPVAAEPRKRPARRRATRSTVAPEGNGD